MIDMTPESDMEWRDIPGYEGSHQVSNTGLVRSLDRMVDWYGTQVFKPGQLLKIQTVRTGHKAVRIQRNGIGAGYRVHRLVLEAFVGPCPPGMECCHNDGDPSNNNVENLRWDTRRNNILDAMRHGTHHWTAKTHCPKGHEYTPENIYRAPKRPNARNCRECSRQSHIERRERLSNAN